MHSPPSHDEGRPLSRLDGGYGVRGQHIVSFYDEPGGLRSPPSIPSPWWQLDKQLPSRRDVHFSKGR